jgi:glutamate/tyrosine decarboxylase-like PLP-dependent enzyme
MRPAYLERQEEGVGGGDPWYCDYGIELSRGFRALKVWASLRAYGLDRLGRAISDNCRQAARMARLVEATETLELGAPVVLNVCCFRYAPKGIDPEEQDALNRQIATRVQLDGAVVFSTTRLNGRTFLRAAITNHRTRDEDIDLAITAVRAACAALARR